MSIDVYLADSDYHIDQTNDDPDLDDPWLTVVSLKSIGSHTLTADGVYLDTFTQVASVTAGAAPEFKAINGGQFDISYFGVDPGLQSATYTIDGSSRIAVLEDGINGTDLGAQIVNFTGNGDGLFKYERVGKGAEFRTIEVNNFSSGDKLNLWQGVGSQLESFTYDEEAGTARLVLDGQSSTYPQTMTVNFNNIDPVLATKIAADPERYFVNGTTFGDPPCFLQGTLIETEHGPVPVEKLNVGDKVRVQNGWKPVKWIGYRHTRTSDIPLDKREGYYPITIKQHAISDGVPSKDINVSSWHHIYVNGVLIRAIDLVNGVTIVVNRNLKRISYYHIELEQFDVILAHGIYSESWTDGGNRDFFQNIDITTLKPEERERRLAKRPGFLVVRSGDTRLTDIQDYLISRAIEFALASPISRAA